MVSSDNETIKRKKDHIDLCLNEDVSFNAVTNGFEKYSFEHYAVTEIDFGKIDLSAKFLGKKISYPFLISCMTGGTKEAEKINESLAVVANELNIPVGVGSQRQALEDISLHETFRVIRKNASNVPVLGNIGAAQVAALKLNDIKFLVDLINADAMVIHVNPLQELLQKNGEPNFKGMLKNIEKIIKKIKLPVIVKEVGSGISKRAAEKLLDAGVSGIDVAGAGGTSWAEVELKRNNQSNHYFRNWGLPTTYCIREVAKLKKSYNFSLIASGGIKNGIEIAKAIALGADLAASARPVMQSVVNNGVDETIKMLLTWFEETRKIMYLTGCANIKKLSKQKLLKSEELY